MEKKPTHLPNPDLVVEILSPANPGHDLSTKRRLYEQSGIPEYWIVFPDEHQVLQLVLQEGRYQESTAADTLVMNQTPHTTVDLTRVW